MPASFTIDPDRRLVLSRAWGVLVDADLQATQLALRDDPQFAPDFDQLYDFSAVTEVRLTSETLQALARHSPFARDARRAIVVGSEVAFGMARMYQLAADRDPAAYRVFRDAASAHQWLLGGDDDDA